MRRKSKLLPSTENQIGIDNLKVKCQRNKCIINKKTVNKIQDESGSQTASRN